VPPAPETTFHLVPRAEWQAAPADQPYVPRAFAHDGFVHCTDGADEVAATANRYYRDETDLLVLRLDTARLGAPVRYEDARHIYPHIYGPIERAAILSVQPMRRDPSGAWLPPP
jgi:uncharacterized protein (DUF952 family)